MTDTLLPEVQSDPLDPPLDAEAALVADMLARNKTVLFDALAAAGISEVVVDFDGYTDSGQIEDIQAWAGDEAIRLPDSVIAIARRQWDKAESVPVEMRIADAVEHLAYALLAQTHGGWENNDGAFGEFVFDVEKHTITLGYNERYMTSEHEQHVF